jgi:multiple sugar transport system substrate-binding protein
VKLAASALKPATVSIPDGGFNAATFLRGIGAGHVPDVIYLDRRDVVAALAAKGAIKPLTSCVDSEGVDLKQFRQATLDEVTYRRRLYALPEFTNEVTLIVNDTAVSDAGLKRSDIQTSDWPALLATATRLTKRSGGGIDRLGFDPQLPQLFPLWAKANGADLLSKDGLHAHLDDPKAVEALEYTKSLIDAQGGWSALKAAQDTFDFFGARNPWVADQVGAVPLPSGFFWYVLARNSPDAEVRAVPFKARDGKTITFFSGWNPAWAIPTRAKHPVLACRFIKTMTSVKAWMVNARVRAATARRGGYAFSPIPTGNRTADARIHRELYKSMSPSFDAAAKLLLKVQDDAFVIPPSPAAAEIQQVLQDAINRVLAGAQSPRVALEQAQREAQAAIAAAS